MGATFRHPVVSLDDAGFIAWARKHGVTLWASAADGVPLQRALDRGRGKGGAGRVDGPIAVIVGNEGAGIRPQLNAVAAQRVAIPLAQGAESLNVAVAAGMLACMGGTGGADGAAAPRRRPAGLSMGLFLTVFVSAPPSMAEKN